MTHTTGFGTAIAGPDACALRAQVAEHGTPLLLLDCDRIRAQYRALAAALPGVALHYAIKALPRVATSKQPPSAASCSIAAGCGNALMA